jgi:cyclic pyranopterin phosphate synthase
MMHFETGCFSVVEGGSGGDCQRCNRLRLSSDGKIRPCLFSDISFNTRLLGSRQAIRQAVSEKPKVGGPCKHNWMHGIGG